jgi:predicted nucleic acid-binding protein
VKLVVDTNVFVSALISDSATRRLLRSVDEGLVAPEMLQYELERHDELVRKTSGLTRTELDVLVRGLLEHVELLPAEALDPYRDPAANAMGDVDPDDVIFLATALAVGGAIWSDDLHFREQNLVPVVATRDVMDEVDSGE